MPDYRRSYVPGGTYFFTVVTHERRPIFQDPVAVGLLGDAMRHVREKHPFQTVAIVVLWDHLHCIWTLPPGDDGYSGRWRWIKKRFSQRLAAMGEQGGCLTPSRRIRRELVYWQRRFWEHTIRDESDLEAFANYIHYNPVKHGYTARAADWPWSTFHNFVRAGDYDQGWGTVEPNPPRFPAHE